MLFFWTSVFVMLNFLLLNTVQATKEDSTIQLSTDSTEEVETSTKLQKDDDCNKSSEVICTPQCDCVETRLSPITINSWITLQDWIINCISEYRYESAEDSYVEFQYSPQNKTKQRKRYSFLLMTLGEIYELLESIDDFKYDTQIFLQMYEKSLENVTSNTNRNFSDCYKYEYFQFIYNEIKYLDVMYEHTWWVYVFQKYVEIPIVITVFLLGFLMTGTLLLIFIKHKELRTEQNMIIFNIAICDFLSLTILYPMHYIFFNGICTSYNCADLYLVCAVSLTSVNGLSVLALGIQRLIAVTECLQKSCCAKMNKRCKVILFVSCVWGSSVLFIVSNVIEFSGKNVNLILAIVSGIISLFFLITLPIAITIINCIVAIKLNRSAREMPGESANEVQKRARYRSSRVVNFLCFVFWVTHGPFFLEVVFLQSKSYSRDIFSLKYKYATCAFHGLFCLSAFFNPLALTIMSKHFHILFKQYLICLFLPGNRVRHGLGKRNSISLH